MYMPFCSSQGDSSRPHQVPQEVGWEKCREREDPGHRGRLLPTLTWPEIRGLAP